jgi:FAD/FMN-containing dehydrogenase
MKSILSFDPLSCVAVVEAGVVLQSLEDYLCDYQQNNNTSSFTVPLDLGAKGSCCIGGNVATNAGGQRLLRYGSLHGSVLGLEVVSPDGTVIDLLSTLRKDNTGYDLKQLFIGSEGTLGVITKVALLCPPKPTSVNVALLAVGSFNAALEVLKLARQRLAEVLSAFEFLDETSMQLTLQHIPAARLPFSSRGYTGIDRNISSSTSSSYKQEEGGNIKQQTFFYILIETSGSNASHDAEKLDQFLTLAMDQGLVVDGAVAQDASQAASFWLLREGVTEALRSRGGLYKYDFSLPIGEMYALVEDTERRIQEEYYSHSHHHNSFNHQGDGEEKGRDRIGKEELQQQQQQQQQDPFPPYPSPILVAGFGHMGDGNLHLNISATQYSPRMEKVLEPWLYEQVAARRGSISAEHGVGLTKADCIQYSKSDSAIEMMKKVKMLFDPVGILNPYKVVKMK